MKQTSSTIFRNFQLMVFAVTYTFSSVFLLWILLTVLPDLQPVYTFLLFLIIIVILAIYGSYLYVLFSVPQKMARAFDRIKNRVSLGIISDEKELSVDLFEFLQNFFNYSFLDVYHASLKVVWGDVICSDDSIKELLNWAEIEKDATCTSAVCMKQVKSGKEKYYSYSIPIWFEGLYLGYYTVFTKQKLGKMRKKFFLDLEEFFIDDLLIRLHPDKDTIKLQKSI